jgi:succinate dehydrogenase / fumarate reductase membrane anchor subunit
MHHNKAKKIQTDLARVRGLGSAHHGTGHWMAQKITALANIPLVGWMVYAVVDNIDATHTEFTAWLAQPLNAILMILFVISTFYHAQLGAQVITEDYVSCKVMRLAKIVGQKLFLFALAVACIFSILKIAL